MDTPCLTRKEAALPELGFFFPRLGSRRRDTNEDVLGFTVFDGPLGWQFVVCSSLDLKKDAWNQKKGSQPCGETIIDCIMDHYFVEGHFQQMGAFFFLSESTEEQQTASRHLATPVTGCIDGVGNTTCLRTVS